MSRRPDSEPETPRKLKAGWISVALGYVGVFGSVLAYIAGSQLESIAIMLASPAIALLAGIWAIRDIPGDQLVPNMNAVRAELLKGGDE